MRTLEPTSWYYDTVAALRLLLDRNLLTNFDFTVSFS